MRPVVLKSCRVSFFWVIAAAVLGTTAVGGLSVANPAQKGRSAKSKDGPIPEIAKLLAQKPGARIAVVQGSFHWVHNGHMALYTEVAKGLGKDFDLVVALPTYTYGRKPFLRASHDERVDLIGQAVEDRSDLRGRVVVSKGMKQLPNPPHELMQELIERYPDANFSYVLGGRSFNESLGWPGFSELATHRNVKLIVVKRPDEALQQPERAAQILEEKGSGAPVFSTEIRAALDAGDVSSLEGRVPPTTWQALQKELALREKTRVSGAALLPGPKHSYKSFEQLQKEIPEGAPNILKDVPEARLDEETRQRLATLQERINYELHALEDQSLAVDKRGIDPQKGARGKKLMLQGHKEDGTIAGFHLFIPSEGVVAAKKDEAMALLANAVGLPTPLAHHYEFHEPGAKYTQEQGVLLGLIGRMEPAEKYSKRKNKQTGIPENASVLYDFRKAGPKALESLLVTRWLNEVIGNQDVWQGQLLIPKGQRRGGDEILAIDWEGAFIRRDPKVVKKVIKKIWKEDWALSKTRWTNRLFKFERPLGWDPRHLDSIRADDVYGNIYRLYLTGQLKVDPDLEVVKQRIQAVKKIPRRVIANILEGWLATAEDTYWNHIPLQAAKRTFKREEINTLLIRRLYRSIDEYCNFLDRLARARKSKNRLYEFYVNASAG